MRVNPIIPTRTLIQLVEDEIAALRCNGEQSAVAKGHLQVGRRVAAPKNELDQLGWESEKHLNTDEME